MARDYIIRRAESSADGQKLHTLFSAVFHPEQVGVLAATMFRHLPGMHHDYWFLVEDRKRGQLVSGFALIPWQWKLEGVRLKVAEMGIVGTLKAYRGQGLFRMLNREFEQTLADEGFDLAVIQGIPGFYDQFGYAYAIPLENHINLPLHLVREPQEKGAYAIRLAETADIPFLMKADEAYRQAFALAAFRDAAHWAYLLTESSKTEYGSAFWIIEREETAERFYCRIPADGFGSGLIISEISADISLPALLSLFYFGKEKARQRDKPYIRLNLHNDSFAGRTAVAMGAQPGTPYAWQVRIPDTIRFLTTLTPVLEQRLRASRLSGFSGVFRLNFFRSAVDLQWEAGLLVDVTEGKGTAEHTFAVRADLFPALCLGHRTWQEVRHIHPDVSAGSELSSLLLETLFPVMNSWIHEQY